MIETLMTHLGTMSTGLFDIASKAYEFVTTNELCMVGLVVWVFVTGFGILGRVFKGI